MGRGLRQNIKATATEHLAVGGGGKRLWGDEGRSFLCIVMPITMIAACHSSSVALSSEFSTALLKVGGKIVHNNAGSEMKHSAMERLARSPQCITMCSRRQQRLGQVDLKSLSI